MTDTQQTSTTAGEVVAAVLAELAHPANAATGQAISFAIGSDEFEFVIDKAYDSHALATIWRDDENGDAEQLYSLLLDIKILAGPRPLECIVCGENAEACECVDPFSPDYDPTDADIAPRWDAIPVNEQHAISGRIKTALAVGDL